MNEFFETLAPQEKKVLQKFVQKVIKDGHVSINMKEDALLGTLEDQYKNIHELSTSKANGSRQAQRNHTKAHLGKFDEKRNTFETCFKDGKSFRYGALNIGSLGALRYGHYCVVLKLDSFETNRKSAYIKADSLNAYVQNGQTDKKRLQNECANHGCRHLLVGEKLSESIQTMSESNWASLVCSNSDYLEVIFLGTVQASHIKVLRMSPKSFDLLYGNGFEAAQEKLSPDEHRLSQKYTKIAEYIEQNNIEVEVMNHD